MKICSVILIQEQEHCSTALNFIIIYKRELFRRLEKNKKNKDTKKLPIYAKKSTRKCRGGGGGCERF